MTNKKLPTKFPGVRFRLSKDRLYRGKSEMCFFIRYRLNGSLVEESAGWQSEGMTAQLAAHILGEIKSNIRTGKGFQSLQEKRALESERRSKEQMAKAESDRENMPISVLFHHYLEWAQTNKKSWRDDRNRYNAHVLPSIGSYLLNDVNLIALERLKKDCQKKNLAPATVKHVLVLVRQAFNWAVNRELFNGVNPVRLASTRDKGFLKTPDNKRTRFLTRDEATELLSALSEKSWLTHDITLLSLYSGMRLGEVFNLRWQDVDLEHGIIHIRDAKAGCSRTAYITPPIDEVLKRRSPDSSKMDFIFPSSDGKKITEFSNTFDRTVNDLGLNKAITDPREKVVGHTLRHTFASWLAQKGISLLTIQKLMGHKNIEMTIRYAHLSPSIERDAALSLTNL